MDFLNTKTGLLSPQVMLLNSPSSLVNTPAAWVNSLTNLLNTKAAWINSPTAPVNSQLRWLDFLPAGTFTGGGKSPAFAIKLPKPVDCQLMNHC